MLGLGTFLLITTFSAGAFGSDVLIFTDTSFERNIKEHPLMLVEFYAPWCGHCKQLAPEYEIAATRLKSTDPPVPIAKVDCTAETKVCQKYGVSGYPTLKVFRNGEVAFDYGGERNADGIVKYMYSKAGPVFKELQSSAEFEKFSSSHQPVVVGFFKEAGSRLQKAFETVAGGLSEDFRFALTNNKDLVEKYGGGKDQVVILLPKSMHNKFEEKVQAYAGGSDADSIRQWVEKNIMGLAGVRSSSNTKYFSQRPLVVAHYNVDYENNAKSSNYWRNRLLKVATEIKQKTGKAVQFAVSSLKSSSDLKDFGVTTPDDKKLYITALDSADKKFIMKGDFSPESFSQWLTSFLEGKEEPYMKSEPLPASNSDPVKVVVAKNFDEIVNNPEKDVLIEFYAPWCGHCKSLEPKYKELGEKLKAEKGVTIAKMDATANDVPAQYTVTGFPTIFFARKGAKMQPKKYEGAREVDDFIRYIAESSTDPLSAFDRKGNKSKKKKSEL